MSHSFAVRAFCIIINLFRVAFTFRILYLQASRKNSERATFARAVAHHIRSCAAFKLFLWLHQQHPATHRSINVTVDPPPIVSGNKKAELPYVT